MSHQTFKAWLNEMAVDRQHADNFVDSIYDLDGDEDARPNIDHASADVFSDYIDDSGEPSQSAYTLLQQLLRWNRKARTDHEDFCQSARKQEVTYELLKKTMLDFMESISGEFRFTFPNGPNHEQPIPFSAVEYGRDKGVFRSIFTGWLKQGGKTSWNEYHVMITSYGNSPPTVEVYDEQEPDGWMATRKNIRNVPTVIRMAAYAYWCFASVGNALTHCGNKIGLPGPHSPDEWIPMNPMVCLALKNGRWVARPTDSSLTDADFDITTSVLIRELQNGNTLASALVHFNPTHLHIVKSGWEAMIRLPMSYEQVTNSGMDNLEIDRIVRMFNLDGRGPYSIGQSRHPGYFRYTNQFFVPSNRSNLNAMNALTRHLIGRPVEILNPVNNIDPSELGNLVNKE